MASLRAAADADNWSKKIEALLADTPPEQVAWAITQTQADEKKLRASLRSRLARHWPTDTDAYQNACIHFAAGDVRLGKRAYASEIGMPGAYSATLNDSVLATHIQHEDPSFRVASAQMMRPRHLALLQAQVARETDDEVRAKLVEAGRRLAQERGAPPSTLLDDGERLVAMARQLGRGKHWMRWSTLADCIGAETSTLKQAAAGAEDLVDSGAFVFVTQGRMKPPPVNAEALDDRETSLRLTMDLKNIGPKKALTLVELWLRSDMALYVPELRFWLGIDWLTEALQGVSLRSGDDVLVVRDSQLVGTCDDNTLLRIQHPAADPKWQGDEPLWQRNRPVYTREDLPAQSEAIEYKEWSKRTKKLGYTGIREQKAVQRSRRPIGNVTIDHSPYGHGYGGNVPVTFESIGSTSASGVITSEIVWDARRIVGLDALKPKKSEFC